VPTNRCSNFTDYGIGIGLRERRGVKSSAIFLAVLRRLDYSVDFRGIEDAPKPKSNYARKARHE
jgi:hypothetical protein